MHPLRLLGLLRGIQGKKEQAVAGTGIKQCTANGCFVHLLILANVTYTYSYIVCLTSYITFHLLININFMVQVKSMLWLFTYHLQLTIHKVVI